MGFAPVSEACLVVPEPFRCHCLSLSREAQVPVWIATDPLVGLLDRQLPAQFKAISVSPEARVGRYLMRLPRES
jgi:hypothetical protein